MWYCKVTSPSREESSANRRPAVRSTLTTSMSSTDLINATAMVDLQLARKVGEAIRAAKSNGGFVSSSLKTCDTSTLTAGETKTVLDLVVVLLVICGLAVVSVVEVGLPLVIANVIVVVVVVTLMVVVGAVVGVLLELVVKVVVIVVVVVTVLVVLLVVLVVVVVGTIEEVGRVVVIVVVVVKVEVVVEVLEVDSQ